MFCYFFVATFSSELVIALKPLPRFYKPGWHEKHNSFVDTAKCTSSRILLIDDSIVSGLTRYSRVWSKYFELLNTLTLAHQETVWRMFCGGLNMENCQPN